MRPKVDRTLMAGKRENARDVRPGNPYQNAIREELPVTRHGLLGTPRPAIIDSTLRIRHDTFDHVESADQD